VADKLTPSQQIALANQSTRFSLSSILHGEHGALSLSVSLCQIMKDPGAQEYAANQAREEARHVTAFSRYVQARWGTPLGVGPTLGNLLEELVLAPEVYKKLVGMQMLVEGLAMGVRRLPLADRGPLLRRMQLDDRRSLPPSLREDLGGPRMPEPARRNTTGRSLGGEVLPDAALQPGERRAEAGDLQEFRARLAVGPQRRARGVHG
jgi:hypothetical protein